VKQNELVYSLTNVLIAKIHIIEAKRTWIYKKLWNREEKQTGYILKCGTIKKNKKTWLFKKSH
jgi:hypothetical protein